VQRNIFNPVCQELDDTAKKDVVISDEKILMAEEM
jgi:hypothetical protein